MGRPTDVASLGPAGLPPSAVDLLAWD